MICQFETPPFIYSSYIMVIVLGIATGFIVLFRNSKHPANRNAFYFIILISFWMFNDLIQWITHNFELSLLLGRLNIISYFIYLNFLFFSYHFTGVHITLRRKILLALPILIILPLAFTNYNYRVYDAKTCDFEEGPLVFYAYLLSSFYVIFSSSILYKALKNPINTYYMKRQIRLIIGAFWFFLISGIAYETVWVISTRNNSFIEISPYFAISNLIFISLIAFAIIKQDLFEFNTVLTTGFTIIIWSLMFLLLIFAPFDIIVAAIVVFSYLALMYFFWKM